MASTALIACRWDWCRSSFTTIDALDTHVKHEHIWPMKPMRKGDIALMRRMDLQSLHSSPITDSSTMLTGLIAGVPRSKTPLPVPPRSTPQKRPENEVFDTFAQLSSPLHAPSHQGLPASPALECLIRQNGHSRPSAAVERAYAHKAANQHLRWPSHSRSPTRRPPSQSSGSSQEVVEQQLTQVDDAGSQPPLLSELQIENESIDAELRWPTDDELNAIVAEEVQNSKQPVSKEDSRRSISPGEARGQNFRCGSLSVPLSVKSHSPSQGSHSQSQPIVLQTQAPYSSQTTGWDQTQ